MYKLSRYLVCLLAAVAFIWVWACIGMHRTALLADRQGFLGDFELMWTTIQAKYCFFSDKATDWQRVYDLYRPRVRAAKDRVDFIQILEAALEELYDPHTHLNVNLASSGRLPPYDIWAAISDGEEAKILEVLRGSAAERAGVRPGQVVLALDGEPIGEPVARRLPRTLRQQDPAARSWALLAVLAGRHDRDRLLRVRDRDGSQRDIRIPNSGDADHGPSVRSRRLTLQVGYIAVSSFADEAVTAAFDEALLRLRDTGALVIDVRDNPGGDTAIGRPVMGRFIIKRQPYAWMARRQGGKLGPRWREVVEPRGPFTYTAPVVILVNHFSMSMAEGFAMGMQGIGRAVIVGTPMAGLGAGVDRVELPFSRLTVQFSAEPVYHVNGTPRWFLQPTIAVALDELPWDDKVDPVLRAGLREAERLIAHQP